MKCNCWLCTGSVLLYGVCITYMGGSTHIPLPDNVWNEVYSIVCRMENEVQLLILHKGVIRSCMEYAFHIWMFPHILHSLISYSSYRGKFCWYLASASKVIRRR